MKIQKERYNTGLHSIVRSFLFKRLLFERNAPQTPFFTRGNVLQ
ncbi:hypothetical protein HMPREF1348_00309 [Enterococcus faecium 505]|uniref:Uncharacterized protein n=1 Tax=Enterococcus faecium 505 TaxID=1134806 RepID=J7CYA0_ENTFC|nr:hypothetical protein HMPREF1348_00309 [Enterococcus faecium 505]